LTTNHAISNLIREDKVHQIYSQMQIGQGDTGMQTQTQSIMRFYKDGRISREVALQYANKPDEVARALNI
jgi:twitching motility protein PilT